MAEDDMADDDDGRSLGQTVSDTNRQVQKGKDDRDKGGVRGGLKAAGSSLMRSGSDEMDRASSERITPSSFRKGGKIRKSKRKGKRQVKPRD